MAKVKAHTRAVTLRYRMVYPEHDPRGHEATAKDFAHIHRTQRKTARCFVGERLGFGECRDAQGSPAAIGDDGVQSGLELHHAHIEDALINGVDLAALEHDYPGISNAAEVGKWAQSPENLRWLCAYHHRGAAGAHSIAHAAWESGLYVPGLIS